MQAALDVAAQDRTTIILPTDFQSSTRPITSLFCRMVGLLNRELMIIFYHKMGRTWNSSRRSNSQQRKTLLNQKWQRILISCIPPPRELTWWAEMLPKKTLICNFRPQLRVLNYKMLLMGHETHCGQSPKRSRPLISRKPESWSSDCFAPYWVEEGCLSKGLSSQSGFELNNSRKKLGNCRDRRLG